MTTLLLLMLLQAPYAGFSCDVYGYCTFISQAAKAVPSCRFVPSKFAIGPDPINNPWLEYYICGERLVGMVRNKQNSTGDENDSQFWLAETAEELVIGTFTSRKAAERAVRARYAK